MKRFAVVRRDEVKKGHDATREKLKIGLFDDASSAPLNISRLGE